MYYCALCNHLLLQKVGIWKRAVKEEADHDHAHDEAESQANVSIMNLLTHASILQLATFDDNLSVCVVGGGGGVCCRGQVFSP